MEKEKESVSDFVLSTDLLLKLYPKMNKESVSKMLYRLKKKKEKPKSGVLLGSEYCEMKGIKLGQLRSIVFP